MSSSDSSSLTSDSHVPRLPRERPSVQIDSSPPSPVRANAPVTPLFEKRTLRKVDLGLLPPLSLVYTLAFIDAINLAVARREGADEEFDLLVDHRYFIISAAFFIPYVLFQLPLNFALRRVGGATWLGTVLFLVGAVQVALGFVNGWGQFLGVRTVLGLLQAVILPGCVYLISCWYTRAELQTRLALFYSASVFFASFSNILALGLSKIHVRHMHGWRWIFAIEGILTVFVSFYAYTHIMPFPDQSRARAERVLSEDEINLMRQRIDSDRNDYIPDTLTWNKLRHYLSDITIWAYGFLTMSSAILFNLPQVYFQFFATHRGQNFSNAGTQLLFIPPGIIATAIVIPTGILADYLRTRGLILIVLKLFTVIGICMIGFSDKPGVKYTGCLIAYASAQANVPTILTYQANNVRRHSKRLVTVSLVASLGGVGGLLSVTAFPISAAPKYTAGIWLALALQISSIFVVLFLMGWMHRANKLAEAEAAGEHEEEVPERRGRRQRMRVYGHPYIEGSDRFRYML